LEFTTWSAPISDGDFVISASGWNIGSIALNLTVADLDGDRLPEAIFSNVVPDSLTILRPDGAGSFSFWRRLPTPILPRHTVAADIDADGWLDLVCCGSGPNEIAVFRNLGLGNMAPYVAYPTGETPYGAFAGDVDADGDLDIVTANFNGHDVSVLANHGDGTFAAPASYSAGAGADSPRWVDGSDLDGDGDVDLVCCNGYSSDVSVFVNDGTGVMAVQSSRIPVQTSPNFLEIRDLDGDALADVVTVNAGPGSISFLKGNGDGTFQSAMHDSVGGTLPYGLQVADIDGDVDLDVVVPIRGITPNAWRIMWNYGGTFGQGDAYTGGTHCHTVGTADWDFDGDLDVIAGYAISQNMYFYEHAPVPVVASTDPPANATGAPRADPVRLWFSTGLSPESMNEDAFVVSGGQSGPMSVGLAWSPATNELTITPSSPFAPGEIVTVTVTGDGAVQSDEGVPHPGFAFEFLTEGAAASGSFSPSTIPLSGTDPVHVAAADLDEDAVNDLVVANFLSSDVTVLLTGGSGLPEV
ncbi:MAG: FG-GAP-like repeat-containing protein, partial [bacterium]